jgi:zinc transporter ZupT
MVMVGAFGCFPCMKASKNHELPYILALTAGSFLPVAAPKAAATIASSRLHRLSNMISSLQLFFEFGNKRLD